MTELAYTADTGIAGIRARELTVADIRSLLKRLESGEFDLVGETLLGGISLAELDAMTDATPEQLDGLKPSELRTLADKCREVNADFFAWRGRLTTATTPTPLPAGGTSSATSPG